jgi:uncharacterized protein
MNRRVFDVHSHAFPDNLASKATQTLVSSAKWCHVRAFHDGTVRGLVESMDRAGVEKTLLCSVATRPGQVTKITDWSVSVASDRVVPFASVHPDFEQPEREIDRIAGLGIRGLKFHPQYMGCALDDPRAVRIARAAARCGLAVVTHAGFDVAYAKTDIASPIRVRRLLDAVPDLRLLASHMGGFLEWDDVLVHLVGADVYFDTSFSFGHCSDETLLRMIEGHPPERLLFGSDSPWGDQAADLAAFDRLPLSDEKKRLALWDNAVRFAGLA